jgi:SAM-dependent methyltransferase
MQVNEAADAHWDSVYRSKDAARVSWYQAEPQPSLDALDRLGARSDHAFIDIGGGASSLVDSLIGRGWTDLAVLDLAGSALDVARDRIGDASSQVDWICADVTEWRPSRHWDVWHDRAVFHFLIGAEQRQAYKEALGKGLSEGGLFLIGTFAPDGPDMCSGLPVHRYDAKGLQSEFGADYALLDTWREVHTTPWGSEQNFTWCAFRKRG